MQIDSLVPRHLSIRLRLIILYRYIKLQACPFLLHITTLKTSGGVRAVALPAAPFSDG